MYYNHHHLQHIINDKEGVFHRQTILFTQGGQNGQDAGENAVKSGGEDALHPKAVGVRS